MDENLGKFIDNFARLVELAQSGQHRMQAGTQLLTTLTDHLAVPAESVSVVVERDSAAPFRGRGHAYDRAREQKIRSSNSWAWAAGTNATISR